MEQITDLCLFNEGEKATRLKLSVKPTVFSKDGYNNNFYPMFFLQ